MDKWKKLLAGLAQPLEKRLKRTPQVGDGLPDR